MTNAIIRTLYVSKQAALLLNISGMGASEAHRYHESRLDIEGFSEFNRSNSHLNPPLRSVTYLYSKWRIENLGPRAGVGVMQVS